MNDLDTIQLFLKQLLEALDSSDNVEVLSPKAVQTAGILADFIQENPQAADNARWSAYVGIPEFLELLKHRKSNRDTTYAVEDLMSVYNTFTATPLPGNELITVAQAFETMFQEIKRRLTYYLEEVNRLNYPRIHTPEDEYLADIWMEINQFLIDCLDSFRFIPRDQVHQVIADIASEDEGKRAFFEQLFSDVLVSTSSAMRVYCSFLRPELYG